jgi:regulation of enolase protein 1 (concanavalin A-like superfamily)
MDQMPSKQILWRLVLFVALVAATSFSMFAQRGVVGQFDGHADIGAPATAGTATHDAGSREYTVAAAGVNMWGQRDEFHFVWKRITGDFTIQARVELVGKGVNAHRKAGLMVRSSQDADAAYVDGVVHGDGLTSLQFRRTKGAVTEEQRVTTAGAEIVKLQRKGNTYTFSAAKAGESFMTTELADVALGDSVLVGLVVCSHDPGVTERAIFGGVKFDR